MRRFYSLILALALLLPVQAFGAFAVSRTVIGLELKHFMNNGVSRPVQYAGVAAEVFTKGQVIVLEAGGLATGGAAAGTDIIGVSLENKTIPAATSYSDTHLLWVETNLRDAVWKINLDAAAEIEEDGDVDAVSTAGAWIAFGTTLGATTDDDLNGHSVICYSGPCKGQWRVILDYDDTGGANAGEQEIQLNRPFYPNADTSSSMIILGTGTADQGIHPGETVDLGGTDATKMSGDDYAGPLLIVGFDEIAYGIAYVQIVDTMFAAP